MVKIVIISIVISAPPKFESEKYDEVITLKAGTSKVIEVPFTGHPQPKVTWTCEGSPIKEKRIETETIVNMSCLRLKGAKREDKGCYTVTMESEFGSCTRNYTVIVLGELDFI